MSEGVLQYRYSKFVWWLLLPTRFLRKYLWNKCQSRYEDLRREAIYELFSSVGKDKIKKILELSKDSNYVNLAKVYYDQHVKINKRLLKDKTA